MGRHPRLVGTVEALASEVEVQRRRFLARLGAVAGAAALFSVPAGAAPAIPQTRHERLEGLHSAGRRLRSSEGGSRSDAVEAPFRFTMVGFELPEGASELRVRTSDDGHAWSGWVTLGLLAAAGEHADDGDPAEPAPTRSTEPLWVGRARWLQVDGPDPDRIGVDLIDSDGASADGDGGVSSLGRSLAVAGPPPAHAQAQVLSRAQWGADESWRGDRRPLRQARAAVVHHTAGANGYGPGESAGIVRGIYRYHTQTLGWSDIGYSLLVDRYGQVFEGRAGGLERTAVGAHAAGFNADTVGLAVLGSFGAASVPAAAEDALVRALAEVFSRHRLDPRAGVTLLSRGSSRFGSGTELDSGTVVGHGDLGYTSCPGSRLDARLGALHERAAGLAESQSGPARLGQPEGDPSSGPVDRLPRRAPAALSAAAAAWFWASAGTVIVASAADFPDALAGATLAAEHDAPLLLTDPAELSSDIADRIRALGAARAVVLGGSAAVSDGVAAALRSLGLAVERVAGEDRFATAAQVARQVGAPAGDVAICLGRHEESHRAWPDAVSAGGLAATTPRVPILLTEHDGLPDATTRALGEIGARRAFVIGGTAAIAPTVESELAGRGLEVVRLAGRDRYATSLAVARETRSRIPATQAPVVFASGEEFTHAVVGGGIAARRSAPMVLLPRADLGQATGDYLRQARGEYEAGVLLGDAGTVSDRVRWQLNQALSG